jgi:hypothetical protein
MRRAAPMLAWALLLALAAGGLAAWTSDRIEIVLLPAAVVVTLLVAAAAWRARDREALTLADTSASGPLLAIGVTGVVVGAAVGAWASLMGAGVLALALTAAIRERRP